VKKDQRGPPPPPPPPPPGAATTPASDTDKRYKTGTGEKGYITPIRIAQEERESTRKGKNPRGGSSKRTRKHKKL